ncbi:NACHT domain-containing protein [Crocosphaera chwakensis]|uniref:NACHT domain-containing protein n=1 Tax=Crocosphaera chwakensis CCY0110 TaxID=391612 RepID=A3IH13_9CHRO|nr:NACHT domain-containing protein [Crocosphaera chwakensis]EAZ94255.1 hypothetical protein CY0110_10282 [Crocosphaera chwakensis CCY0110]
MAVLDPLVWTLAWTVTLVQSESATETDNSCSYTILNLSLNWLCHLNLQNMAAFATIIAAIPVIIAGFKFIQRRRGLESRSEISDSKIRQLLISQLDEDYSERRHDSLHNLIKIDLEIEEQAQRVGNRKPELIPEDTPQFNKLNILNRFFKRLRVPDKATPLSPVQKTIEFYERDDVAEKLLILGEPGAGKTTELLNLADDLLERAKKDEKIPIPVILELSAWKTNQPLTDWLVGQMFETYGLGKAIGKRWLDSSRLIFLLDGLDELGLVNQAKCIEGINQFLAEKKWQPGLVVCCRREEYEQAEIQLDELNGAIYLQKLTDQQIYKYLDNLKRSSLWENLQQDSDLLELARSPLFLSMLVVAYQGNAIRNPQELFNAYIKKQIQDPKCQGTYPPRKTPSPETTLHYLVWLAKKLETVRETEFLIEKMQPTWLESSNQKLLYRLSVGLIIGLILGLSVGLIGWLSVGLIGWLIFGLMGGRIFGRVSIYVAEKVEFSLKKFLSRGLISGLSVGLIFGLSFGLIGGLSLGLIFGLNTSEIPTKKDVNQGIWLSCKNGLLFMLSLGLIFGLIWGLIWGLISGLSVGLSFGLIFGLCFGLDTFIQHFILRLVLYRNGYIPWNYSRFLGHAAKHRFIQRVGGRYRFMHDLLRKHFASMSLDEAKLQQFLNS